MHKKQRFEIVVAIGSHAKEAEKKMIKIQKSKIMKEKKRKKKKRSGDVVDG